MGGVARSRLRGVLRSFGLSSVFRTMLRARQGNGSRIMGPFLRVMSGGVSNMGIPAITGITSGCLGVVQGSSCFSMIGCGALSKLPRGRAVGNGTR